MSDLPPNPSVKVIHMTMRGFVSGIVGLIPVLGLPFCVHALFLWRRTDRSVWNPAAHYGAGGAVLGIIGLLTSLLMIAAISAAIINHAASHPYY